MRRYFEEMSLMMILPQVFGTHSHKLIEITDVESAHMDNFDFHGIAVSLQSSVKLEPRNKYLGFCCLAYFAQISVPPPTMLSIYLGLFYGSFVMSLNNLHHGTGALLPYIQFELLP
jgi:hypothetical protein